MSDLKLIIDKLNYYIGELKVIKNTFNPFSFGHLLENIEEKLKNAFPSNQEYYYIFKYNNIEDVDNKINNIKIIIDLFEKDSKNKIIDNGVIQLKDKLIKLLKYSEKFKSIEFKDSHYDNNDVTDFELWKSNISDLFRNYEFKIYKFEKLFLEVENIEYIKYMYSDDVKKSYIIESTLEQIIREIRQILVEIIIALNKHGSEILLENNKNKIKKVKDIIKNKNSSLGRKCIIRNQGCSYTFNNSNICFIACPSSNEIALELDIIKEKLKKFKLKPYIAVSEKVYNKDIFCEKICSKIIESKFCIAILNEVINDKKGVIEPNPNVYYEYGIMTALNKHIIPIQEEKHKLAFNIQSLDILKYNKSNFSKLIEEAIKEANAGKTGIQNEK